MHHSALLHDPSAASTPTQLSEHLAHKQRQERFSRAAVRDVVTEVHVVPSTLAPKPEPEPKTNQDLWAEWADRQIAAFKEPWFRIVDEIDPDPPEPKRIRIENVQRVVARHYEVSHQDLLSSRRTANLVRPRQVAMYLAKTLTLRSLPEIGRRFGGRDHTTVLHAVRKMERLLSSGDRQLQSDLAAIKASLSESEVRP